MSHGYGQGVTAEQGDVEWEGGEGSQHSRAPQGTAAHTSPFPCWLLVYWEVSHGKGVEFDAL